MIDALLHAAVLMTPPILLAALGGLINRIGGLVNLGLEAMMLTGALVAVQVSAATHSAGAGVGYAMSLVVTRLVVNEVVVGLGFTVMASGLAGAHLSIGVVGLFNEGITGGRGFIALAAFYFGRDSVGRTALGALLFGLFDAAQIRPQGRGAPAVLVQTLPYIVVILVLTGLGWAERLRRLPCAASTSRACAPAPAARRSASSPISPTAAAFASTIPGSTPRPRSTTASAR